MNKKLLVILMSLILVATCFVGTGCEKKTGQSETESSSQSSTESESESTPVESESESKPVESEPESQEPTYAFDALVGYSVIETLPMQITASSTVGETATPSSTQSSVVDVANLAQYPFKNVEINKYSSLIFFVKALNNSAF